MRRFILIIAICTGVLWSGPAGAAAAFGRTAAAYNRGDYAEALDGLRVLAEQGHVRAQAVLGAMYGEGLGVPEDDAEAVKWYRKAAEQGNTGAQNNLGEMYAKGEEAMALDPQEGRREGQQDRKRGPAYSFHDRSSAKGARQTRVPDHRPASSAGRSSRGRSAQA